MVGNHPSTRPYVLQGGGIGGVDLLDSHDISGGKRASLFTLIS